MATKDLYPSIRPSLNLDFANSKVLDPRINFSRASAATYYDGKTVAKAEENLLLNSAILAAQSVTTRAEPYTLSFIGTGTVTLSGTSTAGPLVGTGAANRVSLTFTPTAGTLTLTVTGAVEQAQLEARSVATAYTPTTTQPITNYIPVLQTAPAGVPRFDHNPVTGESLGLLVEEQRTNIVLRSEDFTATAWSKAGFSIYADQMIAPDGTLSADLVEFSSSGQINSNGSAATVAGAHTFSFFVKPYAGLTGNSNFLIRNVTTATNLVIATLTWSSMTVSANGSITALPNGWYRISITAASGISAGDLILGYPISNGFAGLKFFLWGAQLESGSFPTSYNKTEASQVTRAADSAQMTGANFSSWYRQDEGTLVSESRSFGLSSATGAATTFGITDGSIANRVRCGNFTSNLTTVACDIGVGGVSQATFTNNYTGGFAKSSLSVKANDFYATLGGVTPSGDNVGSVPTVNQAQIGNSEVGRHLNGHIKRIAYYPKALPGNLQSLTA